MKNISLFIISLLFFSCQSKKVLVSETQMAPKIKVLIVDGENNHGVWPKTTAMMKDFLEETELFTVDVNRTSFTWSGPHYDESIGVEPITNLLDMYPIEGLPTTTAVDEPKAFC